MPLETELQMVQRHVREGAQTVSRQRELVGRFLDHSVEWKRAMDLLELFEDIQLLHEDHLERLYRKAEQPILSGAANDPICAP
jgi:uncharacterized protein HemY